MSWQLGRGDRHAADKHYRELELFAMASQERFCRWLLVRASREMALWLVAQGQSSGAEPYLELAVGLARKLAEEDPCTTGWAELGEALREYGDWARARGAVEVAIPVLIEAVTLRRKCIEPSGFDPEEILAFSKALNHLLPLLAPVDPETALVFIDQGLHFDRHLLSRGIDGNEQVVRLVFRLQQRGEVLMTLGRSEEALACFEEMARRGRIARRAEPIEGELGFHRDQLRTYAKALDRLGRTDTRDAILAEIEELGEPEEGDSSAD
jgi:tetratricopeptide (TPR) repeat protein